MKNKELFIEEVNKGYTFKGDYFMLGTAMLDKEAIPNTLVKVPLKTINRHGLIAGATGTGKTKTLQNLAESLSDCGIGVLLMDVKGDLSGLSQEGGGHPKIDERHKLIDVPWEPKAYPVELLTISEDEGVRLRATVSEFGPVLFSKILELNDNQMGIVSVIFKYCDDNKLPLLDIKDFRKTLQYLSNEGAEEIKDIYGKLNSSSISVILRKLIELEQQGAGQFFGERSFDVDDLLRTNKAGKAFINILRLVDIQGKPKLFSTFMLCLLAEIFEKFPEIGDKQKPKLVIFIDEAHLIFSEASKALLEQIETIIKLIRSKGVGIFFCTQSPADIPDSVLAQLGMKVQHALRAFTAKDRKAIKLVAENYPYTEHYEVNKLLTELGIGEAFISVLNEKGIPTPLVHTLLKAPASRMDIITDKEHNEILRKSEILEYYNEDIDRKSAYEILGRKIEDYEDELKREEEEEERNNKSRRTTTTSRRRKKSSIEQFSSNPLVKLVFRELTRGILGVMGVKTTRRRRR